MADTIIPQNSDGATSDVHLLDASPRLVSLTEARSRGLVRYFEGTLCINGHVDERLVSNRSCCTCTRERTKRWQKDHPEITKKWMDAGRARYERNRPDRVKGAKKAYKDRNKEKLQEYNAARYVRIKARHAQWKVRYRAEKPWVHAENQRTREILKQRAMPPWVNRAEIQEVYRRCHDVTLETGVLHSVDHIYPLSGKLSCGLHVPWNLQIIPLDENLRKGRKTPDEWRRQSATETRF